jgi:hypothetical protein
MKCTSICCDYHKHDYYPNNCLLGKKVSGDCLEPQESQNQRIIEALEVGLKYLESDLNEIIPVFGRECMRDATEYRIKKRRQIKNLIKELE